MKRYVTGCKHFRDPVLETEYNSFASQSDDRRLTPVGLMCKCRCISILMRNSFAVFIHFISPICTCMMSSSIRNITGPLWGKSTGHRWIPPTKASDAELWCLWSAHEKTRASNRDTGDLRRHRAHYDVTMPMTSYLAAIVSAFKRFIPICGETIAKAIWALPHNIAMLCWNTSHEMTRGIHHWCSKGTIVVRSDNPSYIWKKWIAPSNL